MLITCCCVGLTNPASQSVISHTHSLSHSLSLPPPYTVLSLFLLPLSALHLSFKAPVIFFSFHVFFLPLIFLVSCHLQQNRTSYPPTISPTSPTSSSGKMQWSMTVAGRCFPAQDAYARTTSVAASSWRTRGPPS